MGTEAGMRQVTMGMGTGQDGMRTGKHGLDGDRAEDGDQDGDGDRVSALVVPQVSWSRPGGESGVRSFGDEARLALGCVVDQRAASKEAAQVGGRHSVTPLLLLKSWELLRPVPRWPVSWRTWWRRGCRGCGWPGWPPSRWLCHRSSDIF